MSNPFSTDVDTNPVDFGPKFVVSDHEGDLVLVFPKRVEENFPTNFPNPRRNGEKTQEVVLARVVVLRGADDFDEYQSAVISQGYMIKKLKQRLNDGLPQLGRIGRGDKNDSGFRPWVFQAPSKEDEKIATDYYKMYEEKDPFAS
jgi:hypothetical protein